MRIDLKKGNGKCYGDNGEVKDEWLYNLLYNGSMGERYGEFFWGGIDSGKWLENLIRMVIDVEIGNLYVGRFG